MHLSAIFHLAWPAYLHIKRIVAENLTQGYPDNTFRPNEKVTRAQYLRFLGKGIE